MKQIIFIVLSFLIFSCKKEKSIEENIIGTWETDSLSMNGIVVKGDLLKIDKFFWQIDFKNDSTYSVFQGKNKEFISKGKWKLEENGIKTTDSYNTSMNCEFISNNSIKLIYNNDVKDIHSIMYFSRTKTLRDENIITNETNNLKTKVSGIATYPSDGIPDFVNVYAQNISSKKIYQHKIFDRKQGYFEIELPQGEYYIFSAENSDNFNKPSKNEVIKVINGKSIENVNAQDLFNSNFVPVIENESNETNNITLRLLENLTDLKNINPPKIQTQLQSFNENWIFRNDYSEKGEYFFGKQNEIIKLRLKGIKNTLFYSFLDKNTFEEIKEQVNNYVDLKILKTENDMDYNKKYYETPYHKIMLAEVKENGKIFGYNVMMSTK